VPTTTSDALLILKPDVLSGPFAHCSRALARDTVRGLLAVYGGAPTTSYEVPTSACAVPWALRNIDRKVLARSWYTRTIHDADVHLAALWDLLRSPGLAGDGGTATAELVLDAARALGFTDVTRERRICSYRDFLGLYARNAHFTRLAGSLRDYLVGKDIDVVFFEGSQELTTLHVLKEVLRRVVRYPIAHYDAVENLVHVSDPGATDWTFFAHVVGSTRPEAAVPSA
jgi:hypothetical protein